MTTLTPHPIDGAVLVRLDATGADWVQRLPVVPGGQMLTMTVGRSNLLPVPVGMLEGRGYRLVGVAADHRPIGPSVDVLVPLSIRERESTWWAELGGLATRIFDLRLGPVRSVLAAEIALHLPSLDG